jgi:hypothetical protein
MYDLTDKNREESAALRLFEKISTENVKKFMRYRERTPEMHLHPLLSSERPFPHEGSGAVQG